MRRRARVDVNHAEITDALRAIGVTVQSLAPVGRGCPDLLCGLAGRNVLLEVKAGKGVLGAVQTAWRSNWNGQVATVRTVDEAIAAVRAFE